MLFSKEISDGERKLVVVAVVAVGRDVVPPVKVVGKEKLVAVGDAVAVGAVPVKVGVAPAA